MTTVLSVEDLSIDYRGVPALTEVSFTAAAGEVVGIVGESGSGKSTLGRAILGLLPSGGAITAGRIRLGDLDLTGLSETRLQRLRGSHVGLVPQDPLRSLNPVRTAHEHIDESLRLSRTPGRVARRDRTVELLTSVGIAEVDRVMDAYPHQLSGGMRQRVAIAATLARSPQLLIADEPTTALDVTVQRRVLAILDHARRELGLSVLLVSHDLGLVAEHADRIIVMRAGRIVEHGPVGTVLSTPADDYTSMLIAASTSAGGRSEAPDDDCSRLLEATDLSVCFGSGSHSVHAVADVSLRLRPAETLAIVGESGSGKSTLGRALLRLVEPSAGTLCWESETDLRSLDRSGLRRWRANAQLIAQDPISSFDPRLPVIDAIVEAARTHHDCTVTEARAWAASLLERVGLTPSHGRQTASQLSGGQAQRAAIAKALAVRPRLLVLDEPTSALDVSIQAQVIDLLTELQRESGIAYVFITHDLGLVARFAHRVIVMRAGRVVESGDCATLFAAPGEDYTKALLAATPRRLGSASAGDLTPAYDLPPTAAPDPDTDEGAASSRTRRRRFTADAWSYWARRLALALLTVWGGTSVVFVVTRLFWDPVAKLAGPFATPESVAEMRESLGYDRPLPLQYVEFLRSLVTGEFPLSLTYDLNPSAIIADRLGPSLLLAGTTMIVAIVLGIGLGYLAAVRRGRLADRLVSGYVVLAQSVPDFVIGPVFILLFAVTWRLLPVSGLDGPLGMVLPVLTLALFPISEIAVVLRSSVLESLDAEHVTFARARGVPERTIAGVHVLRVSLLPTVSVIGLTAVEVLTGVVVVEVIFGISGFGSLIQEAVSSQDIPLVEASVALVAITVAAIMLLIDIANRIIDPRLRTR